MTQKISNGNLELLADDIGNAQYDITASYIGKVADKLSEKASATKSENLQAAINKLYEAKSLIDSAWNICKNKMDGECAKHPRTITSYTYTIDELTEHMINDPKGELKIFISRLGYSLLTQADADLGRNRHKLASCLYRASSSLFKANQYLYKS
ncbi:MAG: hypothetical protein ACP5OA_07445 [Candidatus Woesearchaeota archaeon]